VIEWHGPDVSDEDRAAAERLADSVRLADIDRWTETDGERTTLHDEEHGFTVTYPNDGWQVAAKNLTPWLTSPQEILSVGTFDMPVSQDPEDGLRPFDAPAAPAALQALGPSDAFVTVQESGPVESDDRPTAFESCADGERCGPTGSTDNFSWWWIPFRDAGRGLYLLAAIGNDASPEVVDQAWAMADSLRFLASPAA